MKKRIDNVLAEGEATGHAHRACGQNVIVYGKNEKRLLEIPEGATVTHEEHKEITLPPGDYDISIVKEFDHIAKKATRVMD